VIIMRYYTSDNIGGSQQLADILSKAARETGNFGVP
jgi:hypothetical protein